MEKIKSRACKHQSMLASLNSNRSLSFIVLIGCLVFSFPLQTKALTLFSFQESGYSVFLKNLSGETMDCGRWALVAAE